MLTSLGNWYEVKDGDPRAVALYRRHYSCRNPKVDYCRLGFSGIGESMILLTSDGTALFGWRKQSISDCDPPQLGVNCFVFRNEGEVRSSDLICEAEELAWSRWPKERLYTYVNAKKIRSINPGACFKKAGWAQCGFTKGGLLILEKLGSPFSGE